MILLQNSDKYNEIAEFDPATEIYTLHSRSDYESTFKTAGSFAFLSRTFVALYALNGELFTKIGEQKYVFTEGLKILVSGESENRVLKVYEENSKLLELKYSLLDSAKIEGDSTPFIEDEDFDFGLFLSNISNSIDRQNVLLGKD